MGYIACSLRVKEPAQRAIFLPGSCYYSPMACIQQSTCVTLALVLLLVVGESVGDAPGDESCPAQGEQQFNIRVLMDSWRYQTLLSGSGSSSSAVWTSSDHVRSCHAIELWSILCTNSFVYFLTVDFCWSL